MKRVNPIIDEAKKEIPDYDEIMARDSSEYYGEEYTEMRDADYISEALAFFEKWFGDGGIDDAQKRHTKNRA